MFPLLAPRNLAFLSLDTRTTGWPPATPDAQIDRRLGLSPLLLANLNLIEPVTVALHHGAIKIAPRGVVDDRRNGGALTLLQPWFAQNRELASIGSEQYLQTLPQFF